MGGNWQVERRAFGHQRGAVRRHFVEVDNDRVTSGASPSRLSRDTPHLFGVRKLQAGLLNGDYHYQLCRRFTHGVSAPRFSFVER